MVNGSIVAKYVDVYIHYVVVCLDDMVFHYNYNDSIDSSVGRVQYKTGDLEALWSIHSQGNFISCCSPSFGPLGYVLKYLID